MYDLACDASSKILEKLEQVILLVPPVHTVLLLHQVRAAFAQANVLDDHDPVGNKVRELWCCVLREVLYLQDGHLATDVTSDGLLDLQVVGLQQLSKLSV